MSASQYHVAVIGGGPGGYVAAIRCAQLGFKTVCIDKRATLGGSCLNVGCIPSKRLLHVSEHFTIPLDFTKVMAEKDKVVFDLVTLVANLFKKHGIDRVEGSASFSSPTDITVTKSDGSTAQIHADKIIIATGSEPIPLPFAPFDEKAIVSSTGALELTQIPKNFLVVGGGIIGVEIASVYQRLGSKVTIVEMLDHICPGVDPLLAKTLFQSLKKQGLEFHLEAKVKAIQKNSSQLTIEVEKENKTLKFEADAVLVCVGRRPYTKGLNLEKIGVTLDQKGLIQVDDAFQTTQKNIYAIGDVIAGPGLAHRASEEGVVLANHLAGKPGKINYLAIPSVIYTSPEVASVGLTDQFAKSNGIETISAQIPFLGNARARCVNATEGYVKIVGDKKSGRLIGMHIIGANASELIAVGALAIEAGLTIAQLANTPFAHPTLSEAIKEAAAHALGQAIHV